MSNTVLEITYRYESDTPSRDFTVHVKAEDVNVWLEDTYIAAETTRNGQLLIAEIKRLILWRTERGA
jgi:hypothetical protein